MKPERRRLIHWLMKGHAITDDGIAWSDASRSGRRRFDAEAATKLKYGGCVVDGQHYRLKRVGRATYELEKGKCRRSKPKRRRPTKPPPASPTLSSAST